MVEKLRGRDYAGMYKWLRRYVEVLGQIHIGGVKRCVYVAVRVGKGINEVVRVRLSESEEWPGGLGGGSGKAWVLLCQINTVFAAERGVFDVSLSQGLRAGSELSGISLSSFGGKFDLFFFITWIVRCKSLGEFVLWMGGL